MTDTTKTSDKIKTRTIVGSPPHRRQLRGREAIERALAHARSWDCADVDALGLMRSRVRALARSVHRATAAQVHDSRPACCMARGCASSHRFPNDRDALEVCPGDSMTLRRGAYIPTCRRHAAQWLRLVGPCFAFSIGWLPHKVDVAPMEWGVDLMFPLVPYRPPKRGGTRGGVWLRLISRDEAQVVTDALLASCPDVGAAMLRVIAAADVGELRRRQWEARP